VQILSGKEVANAIQEQIRSESLSFQNETDIQPCLAVILVGNDPASATYVASKKKTCEAMGFAHRDYHLDPNCSEKELKDLIGTLNNDINVHGILVQLPLPPHLSESVVIETIDPNKDVDGLHPKNIGRLLLGQDAFIACTPHGVLKILDYYHIETAGKEVVIVGRSSIVGKPMAALLMQKGRDATVTVCHSRTTNLAQVTQRAQILIVAIGKPHAITASMVSPGTIVIDVGINRIDDSSKKRGYRLVGDVDFEQVMPNCDAITPVPGGVGVMTIAMLMLNTLTAAKQQYAKENNA
jgi:methylenetetrahydrofolate dehydrogenase (NADP+) / methenyltetrahydrofolate cyclohydrolase